MRDVLVVVLRHLVPACCLRWWFVEGRPGRPKVHGTRTRTEAKLTVGTARRLEAWARRHEVSVTVALELALRRYLAAGIVPGPRSLDQVQVVRFRLPFDLHRDLRARCQELPAGWSQLVEGAAMALVASEGLPIAWTVS